MSSLAVASSSSAPLAPAPTASASGVSFATLAHLLDARLLRALAQLRFERATPVQARLLPLALAGRDVLAQAPTGSGKTLAYALPAVQSILKAKEALPATSPSRQATRVLVLVPTRELAAQVADHVAKLLACTEQDDVLVLDAARVGGKGVQKLLLSSRPDVVISTPSRALAHLSSSALSLSSLQLLVLDEADLILSYGHSSDILALLSSGSMPSRYQTLLLSATLGSEVRALLGAHLRRPLTLRLTPSMHASALAQYSVSVQAQSDKFLLLYVLLRLKLVRGKALVFVNSTERAYRVRLFLEQFGIKSTVLNEELPAESRFHIVQEFNKGVYDYIIATDDSRIGADARPVLAADDEETELSAGPEFVLEEEEEQDEEAAVAKPDEGKGKKRERAQELAEEDAEESDGEDAVAEAESDDEAAPAEPAKKRKRDTDAKGSSGSRRKGKGASAEYGVSRGIDFVSVACVINFDLPVSARGYTHRIGRTARAGHTGTALSFVVPGEVYDSELRTNAKRHAACPTAQFDEEVWKRIVENQRRRGAQVKEWTFDRKQVESFRYRMEDALRSVTRAAIREARIKEIKQEILNSEKLKAHFEDNPHDLAYLRHDKALHPSRVQSHLKHVPSYLMPRIARLRQPDAATAISEGSDQPLAGPAAEERGVGYVPLRNAPRGRGSRGRGGRGGRGDSRGGRGGGKKSDPLRKFGK